MNIRSAETRKSNREDHHVVNIFVDAEGYPVRFRIQPDLEASLRDRLEYGLTVSACSFSPGELNQWGLYICL